MKGTALLLALAFAAGCRSNGSGEFRRETRTVAPEGTVTETRGEVQERVIEQGIVDPGDRK